MHALLRFLAPVAALSLGGAMLFACGSNSNGTDEWTGHASSDLLCQGEGIHPAGCPIGSLPPRTTPCPLGDTCTATATNLAAPLAGCSAPTWFSQTGTLSAAYFVSTCTAGPAVDAWVSSHVAESWTASRMAAVPGYPLIGEYQTYLTFVPATPTALPSDCNSSGQCAVESNIHLDDNDTSLPCTLMYFFTPNPPPVETYTPNNGPYTININVPGTFSWVAYCTDTPAVDALASSINCANAPVVDGGGCLGAGESPAPDGLPQAGYGYTYYYADVTLWRRHIGGGCSSTCMWF